VRVDPHGLVEALAGVRDLRVDAELVEVTGHCPPRDHQQVPRLLEAQRRDDAELLLGHVQQRHGVFVVVLRAQILGLRDGVLDRRRHRTGGDSVVCTVPSTCAGADEPRRLRRLPGPSNRASPIVAESQTRAGRAARSRSAPRFHRLRVLVREAARRRE